MQDRSNPKSFNPAAQSSNRDAYLTLTQPSIRRCAEIGASIANEFEERMPLSAFMNAALVTSKFDEIEVALRISDNASRRPTSSDNNQRPFSLYLSFETNTRLRKMESTIRRYFNRGFSPTPEMVLNAMIQIAELDHDALCQYLRNAFKANLPARQVQVKETFTDLEFQSLSIEQIPLVNTEPVSVEAQARSAVR